MLDTTAQPGTLEKFHLGISSDGVNCLLLFADENQHTISCVANFSEFHAFITSLAQAAAEMSRRRLGLPGSADQGLAGDEEHETQLHATSAITVTSAAFRMSEDNRCMLGSLVGDSGEVVGLRLHPALVGEMTRAMLLTVPATSA